MKTAQSSITLRGFADVAHRATRKNSKDDSVILLAGTSVHSIVDRRPSTARQGRKARQSLPAVHVFNIKQPELDKDDAPGFLIPSLTPGKSDSQLGIETREGEAKGKGKAAAVALSSLVKMPLQVNAQLGRMNCVVDAARATLGMNDPTPAAHVRFFGAESFESQLEMERWLRSAGITTAFWDSGEAKTAAKLYKEVKALSTIFAVNVDDEGNFVSPPVRVVRVVRVIVKQVIGGKDMYLLEDSQEVGSTGRVRFRRKLLSCIIKHGESCYAAARRNVQKELRNFGGDRSKAIKESNVRAIRDSLKTAVEQVESKSFPTLSTRYILHTLNATILGSLPDDNFSTTEFVDNNTIAVKHYWVWCPYNDIEAIIKLESDTLETKAVLSHREDDTKDPGNATLVEDLESTFNPTLSVESLCVVLRSWGYEESEINAIIALVPGDESEISKQDFQSLIKPEILQRFVTVRPSKQKDNPVSVVDLHIKVLERLFRGCAKLKVFPLHGGYSGSIVLQVHSFIPGKQLTPSVVKIDERRKVQDEYSNYNTVAKALGESAPSILDADIENAEGEEFAYGGIKFELVGAWLFLPDLITSEATLLSSLKEIFRGEQTHEILTVMNCRRDSFEDGALKEEITTSGSGYFSNTLTVIKEVFAEILRVATCRGKKMIARDLFRHYKLEKLIRRNVLQDPSIQSKGKLVDVDELEPEAGAKAFFKYFMEKLQARPNKEEEYLHGVVHGDLNGMNILVDSQEIVWLIDFALTDTGHILRDMAKVESCVLLEYSPLESEEDLEVAKQIVSTLVNVSALNHTLPVRLFKDPTRLDFVWKVIRSLRGYLGYYCASDPDPIQMCFAMLHFSVKALHYRDIGLLHKKLALFCALSCAQRISWCLDINGGTSAKLVVGDDVLEERMMRSLNRSLNMEQLVHEKRIYFHKLMVKECYAVDTITRNKVNIMKNSTTLHVLDAATKDALLSKYKDMDDLEQRRALLKQKSKLVSRKVLAKSLLEHAPDAKSDMHLTKHRFLVVLGGAATGKSCLLRKMLIRTCQDKRGSLEEDAVPVLILLIDLSRLMHKLKLTSKDDLLDAYFKEVYKEDSGTYEFLRFARKNKLLYLLLDGLDEAGTNKAEIERYIVRIRPQVRRITVSSRETGFDDRAFAAFRFAQLLPLTQQMQREIVEARVPDAAACASVLRLLDEPRYSELIKNPLMLTLLISLSTSSSINPQRDPDLPYTKAGLYETAIAQLLHKSSMIKFGMRRGVVDKKIERISMTLASDECYMFLAHLAWNLHTNRLRDVAPGTLTKLVHEHLASLNRPYPQTDTTASISSAPSATTLFRTVGTLQSAVASAHCPLFSVSTTVEAEADAGEAASMDPLAEGEAEGDEVGDKTGKRCVIRFVHLSFQEYMAGKHILAKLEMAKKISQSCFEETVLFYFSSSPKRPMDILTDHWWRAPLLSMAGCINDADLLVDLLRLIMDVQDASHANLMMARAMIDQVVEPHLQKTKEQLRHMLTTRILDRRHVKDVARTLFHPSHHLQRIAVSEVMALTHHRDLIFQHVLDIGMAPDAGWLCRLLLNGLTAIIPELAERKEFQALLVEALFDLGMDIRESALMAIQMAGLENSSLVVEALLSHLQRPGYQIDALKVVEILKVKQEDVIDCVVGLMTDRELKSLACNALKTLLADEEVYQRLCDSLFDSPCPEVKRTIFHMFQTEALRGRMESTKFEFSFLIDHIKDAATRLNAARTYLMLHCESSFKATPSVDTTKTLNTFLTFAIETPADPRLVQAVLTILSQADISKLSPSKLNLLAQAPICNGMERAMSAFLVKLTNGGFVIGWDQIIRMIHSHRALLCEAACAALPNISNMDVVDFSQVEALCNAKSGTCREAAIMFVFRNREVIKVPSDDLLATLLHHTTSEDCSARIRRLSLRAYTDLATVREEKRMLLIANLKTKMLGKSKKDLQVTAMACVSQVENKEVFLTSLLTVLGDSDAHIRATAMSTVRKIGKADMVSGKYIAPFIASSDHELRLAGLELLHLHAQRKIPEALIAMESRLAGIIRREPDLILRANCLSLFIQCGVMPAKIAKSLQEWMNQGGEATSRCISLVFNTLSLDVVPYVHDLIVLGRSSCVEYPPIAEEVLLAMQGRPVSEEDLEAVLDADGNTDVLRFALKLVAQVKIEAAVMEHHSPLVLALLRSAAAEESDVREAALLAFTSICRGKLKPSLEAFEVVAALEGVDLLTLLEVFHLTPANLPGTMEWMVDRFYTLEAPLSTWKKVLMMLLKCQAEFGAQSRRSGAVEAMWRTSGIFETKALELFNHFVKSFNESNRILALLEAVGKLRLGSGRIVNAVFKISNIPGLERTVQSAAVDTVKRLAKCTSLETSEALELEKWTLTARLCWISLFLDVDDPGFPLTAFGKSLQESEEQVAAFVRDLELMLLSDDSSVQLRVYCAAAFLSVAPNSVKSPAVWTPALEDKCPTVSDLIRRILLVSDTARLSSEIVANFVELIHDGADHVRSLKFVEFFQDYRIKDKDELHAIVHMLEQPALAPFLFEPLLNDFRMSRLESTRPSSKFRVNPRILSTLEAYSTSGILEANCLLREIKLEFDPPEMFRPFREEMFTPSFKLLTIDEMEQRARKFEQLKMSREEKLSMRHRKFSFSSVYQLHTKTVGLRQLLLPHQLSRVQWYKEINFFVNYDVTALSKDVTFVLSQVFPEINRRLRLKGISLKVIPMEPGKMACGLMKPDAQNSLIQKCQPYVLHMSDHKNLVEFTQEHTAALAAESSTAVLCYLSGCEMTYTKTLLPLESKDFFHSYHQALEQLRVNPMIELKSYDPEDPEAFLQTMVQDVVTLISLNFQASRLFRPVKFASGNSEVSVRAFVEEGRLHEFLLFQSSTITKEAKKFTELTPSFRKEQYYALNDLVEAQLKDDKSLRNEARTTRSEFRTKKAQMGKLPIWLFGEPGSGMTSFLSTWIDIHRNTAHKHRRLVLYHNCAASPGSRDICFILIRLGAELKSHFSEELKEFAMPTGENLEFSSVKKWWDHIMDRLSEKAKKSIILVVENLHLAMEPTWTKHTTPALSPVDAFFITQYNGVPPGITVVMSCSNKSLLESSRFIKEHSVSVLTRSAILLKELKNDERVLLMKHRMAEDHLDFDPDLFQGFLQQHGDCFSISLAAWMLSRQVFASHKVLQYFVDELTRRPVADFLLDKIESSIGKDLCAKVLTTAVLMEFTTRKQILAIRPELSGKLWTQLSSSLHHILHSVPVHEEHHEPDDLYMLRHGGLRQLILHRYSSLVPSIHADIAGYWIEQAESGRLGVGQDIQQHLALSNVIHHALASHRTSELIKSTLGDLDFIHCFLSGTTWGNSKAELLCLYTLAYEKLHEDWLQRCVTCMQSEVHGTSEEILTRLKDCIAFA